MSSLQQRVFHTSMPFTATGDAPQSTSAPQNHDRNSLESCFSAGLDLAALAGGNTAHDGGGSQYPRGAHDAAPAAASAVLARIKGKAAAHRGREEAQEAALERRVADVAAATAAPAAASPGGGLPRALAPGRQAGGGRDDNFVKFRGGGGGATDGNCGFLSSLVASHATEGRRRGGAMSGRARTLLKNTKASSTRTKIAKMAPRSAGGKKVAKKSRRSKY